jgi:hypothetical protein
MYYTTFSRLLFCSVFAIPLLLLSGCLGKNAFEAAVDPVSGSKQKWNEWSDNGGLNKLDDFYGLKITEVNVTWRDGKVSGLIMFTSQTHSPKDVRKAMANICGGSDSDWKLDDNWARKMGMYQGPTATCRYIDDRGKWELSYLRKN